jgi:hypothetical protein
MQRKAQPFLDHGRKHQDGKGEYQTDDEAFSEILDHHPVMSRMIVPGMLVIHVMLLVLFLWMGGRMVVMVSLFMHHLMIMLHVVPVILTLVLSIHLAVSFILFL